MLSGMLSHYALGSYASVHKGRDTPNQPLEEQVGVLVVGLTVSYEGGMVHMGRLVLLSKIVGGCLILQISHEACAGDAVSHGGCVYAP
jgi:hypothetical protein